MKYFVGLSALAMASLSTSPAQAQNTTDGPTGEATSADRTAGTKSQPGIRDIIVTAEHRQNSIQTTPIAITAFTGEDLVKRNLNSIDDALRHAPAVVLQGNANGAYIYIRGVGSQQDTAIGGPAVNLNVDGVYQQQTDAPFAALFDLERLEVLRGPQGTLYGRNATAGSINIITADPTLDAVHARGNISFGNYSAIKGEAALNVPISETLAVRVSTGINRHTGYLQPSGYDDADTIGGRVKVLWKPSADVKILLASDYTHIGGVGPGAVDPLASHPADPWYSTAPTGKIDITYRRYYAQADIDVGFGSLTVLPALQTYRKYDANVLINYPTPAVTATSGVVNEDQRTLEVRLASHRNSPFTWLIGAYYLNSAGYNGAPSSQIALPASVTTYPYLAGSHTRSLAGFGQITVPVTSRFRVTGGARYTHDYKSLTDQATVNTFLYPQTSFNSFTYKAGVEYDVAPHVLGYANISTGFKAGGLDQGFNAYQPEHLRAIEGGIKSRLLDNRLQINVEGFDYDYKNFQAQVGYRCQNIVACPVVTTFANSIVNAGSATVYGGELEAVLEAWTGAHLNGAVSYTYSNFDKLIIVPGTGTSPATCVATLTCPVLDNQVLTNQPLANAPKWTLNLGYVQDFALHNGGKITFSSDVRYTTGYWTLYRRPPQVPTESFQGAYTKADLSLAYTPASDKWSVNAYVKNVGNVGVVTSAVGPALTIAPPRTYGVQFAMHY